MSLRRIFAACVLSGFVISPALVQSSETHIWLNGFYEFEFDNTGSLIALRVSWRFDPDYSVWATQGLAKAGARPTPQELQPLAKVNVESLSEFDYFIRAVNDGRTIHLGTPVNYSLQVASDGILTLDLTLPVTDPAPLLKELIVKIDEPSGFVDVGLSAATRVHLRNAPQSCSPRVNPALWHTTDSGHDPGSVSVVCGLSATSQGSDPHYSNGQQGQWKELKEYCAQAVDDDQVKPIPPQLVPAARSVLNNAELSGAAYRCMRGAVWICDYGANLICDSKADTRTRLKEVDDFCKKNPGKDVPMVVTGHAVNHFWTCVGSKPRITKTEDIDANGFLKFEWKQVP